MSIQSAFSTGKSALRRGGIALATVASMFAANAAHAGEFSQRECKIIFATSSGVIGILLDDKPGRFSPLFPQSLASFIAPSNPEPVRKIIVEGNFAEIAHSKSAENVALKNAIVPTLTCDGVADIVTPAEEDVGAFMTLRRSLALGDPSIDLQARGVRAVAGPVATVGLNAN